VSIVIDGGGGNAVKSTTDIVKGSLYYLSTLQARILYGVQLRDGSLE
jgi:hypothetical protein